MGCCPNTNVKYMPLAVGVANKPKLKGLRETVGEGLKEVRKII